MLYFSHFFFFLFSTRGDTSITARLQTRKFGQAPILLFLTPRRGLSSHPRVFVMILWESMNFHPVKQRIGPLTLGLQVQRSPLHYGDSFSRNLKKHRSAKKTRQYWCLETPLVRQADGELKNTTSVVNV